MLVLLFLLAGVLTSAGSNGIERTTSGNAINGLIEEIDTIFDGVNTLAVLASANIQEDYRRLLRNCVFLRRLARRFVQSASSSKRCVELLFLSKAEESPGIVSGNDHALTDD